MSATINNEDEVTIEWNLTTLVRPGPIQQHNDQTGVALIVLNQPLEKSLHVIRTLWNNGIYHRALLRRFEANLECQHQFALQQTGVQTRYTKLPDNMAIPLLYGSPFTLVKL